MSVQTEVVYVAYCLVYIFTAVHPGISSPTSSTPYSCGSDQFTCTNDERCIPAHWQCDRDTDCEDHSDEDGCPPQTCQANEFRCNNGRCIPQSWYCDQADDCKDNSDELNCAQNVSCSGQDFKCNNGLCIRSSWKCDRHDDCGDNSDEEACNGSGRAQKSCASGTFSCSNGQCVPWSYVCDGDDDCGNNSDEEPRHCDAKTCSANQFTCQNQQCIRLRWKCDGDSDCSDASDENGCGRVPVCSQNRFRCSDGTCIRGHWKCDGENDCHDGSDEIGCSVNCTADQFKCGSTSKCVEKSKVCDRNKDCPDGEDEQQNCDINECMDHNGHCQQICNDLRIGFECSCHSGYVLAENKKNCDDIDECKVYGMCSQDCQNTKGSYKCLCKAGYQLEPDKKTCKAKDNTPYLLYSTQFGIHKMALDRTSNAFSIVVKNQKGVVAIDYDYYDNYVYWTDVRDERICRAQIPTHGGDAADCKVLIQNSTNTPDGIAIDWVGKKMYWTDGHFNRIEVAELDGSHRLTLFDSELDEPRAIVVDPLLRYLYWTDWGDNPKIEKAAMDGDPNTRQVIVSEGLAWPNGLAIDYPLERIYWADARLKQIESSRYDGSDRRLIASIVPNHPFGLGVFENQLYYTDWYKNGKGINKLNKFSGSDRKIKDTLWPYMDIKVFHPLRQPNATNPCKVDNGGCSHLCLLAAAHPKSRTCRCPDGKNISANGTTCTGKEAPWQPAPTTASSTHEPTTATTQGTKTTQKATSASTKSQLPATTKKMVKPSTRSNNVVLKPSKSPSINATDTSNAPTSSTTKIPVITPKGSVVAFQRKGDTAEALSGGVIAGISIVICLVIILVVLAIWYARSCSNNYRGKSISYYKDMSSKPLEKDFDDDDERCKVFDDRGSRERLEFA